MRQYCTLTIFIYWKSYITLLFGLLVNITVHAQSEHISGFKNDYLLIINTYSSNAPCSNAIINLVQKHLSTDNTTAVYVEHLNTLLIDKQEDFNKVKQGIFTKYAAAAPKIVLLIGNPVLILLKDIRTRWGDVPIIATAEMDFVSPDMTSLQTTAIPEDRPGRSRFRRICSWRRRGGCRGPCSRPWPADRRFPTWHPGHPTPCRCCSAF